MEKMRSHLASMKKKGKFIQSAIKRPGALTRKAKVAGETPTAFAVSHQHDSGLTGRQARFALLLKSFRK